MDMNKDKDKDNVCLWPKNSLLLLSVEGAQDFYIILVVP